MAHNVRTFRLGAATVTALKFAHLQIVPATALVCPDEERPLLDTPAFHEPVIVPAQCFHIALPDTTILVDAGVFDANEDPGAVIPGYQPPTGLLEVMAEAGLRPEGVEHVVITHGHWDHVNGVTVQREGRSVPVFPNARHYVGRGDWEAAAPLMDEPGSLANRTLAVLNRCGLLQLVDDTEDLCGAARIVPTPGETPGHQVLRLVTEGQVSYYLGDLYHLALEVEHPTWMPNWIYDRELKLRSRRDIAVAAVKNTALLFAAHIPSAGRLRSLGKEYAWEPAWPIWE